MNKNLDKDLKDEINKEYLSRDISQDRIDQYDIQLRNKSSKDKELSWITTLLVVLFPFLILIQSIIATRHIENGKTGKWKEYWHAMTIGYLVWLIAFLAFIWFRR